jgi:cell division protein FtsB
VDASGEPIRETDIERASLAALEEIKSLLVKIAAQRKENTRLQAEVERLTALVEHFSRTREAHTTRSQSIREASG